MIILIAKTFTISIFLISTVGVFIPVQQSKYVPSLLSKESNSFPYYPFNSAWALFQLVSGIPTLYWIRKALRSMREELQTWKQ